MYRQISRSQLRLLGLEGGVKTKSIFLDCRDLLSASVGIESLNQDHVETGLQKYQFS
jgi:hypothetical protein